MKSHAYVPSGLLLIAVLFTANLSLATAADLEIPNPCTLVTVEEMQEIAGPLDGPPRATDPASGEITCSYTPKAGPRFIDISLHDGDLAGLKQSLASKDIVSLTEFGKDAFVNPDAHEYTDLYAKKGMLILQVSLPMGPEAVEIAKAVARKALPRL